MTIMTTKLSVTFVAGFVLLGSAAAQSRIPVTPSQPTSFKRRDVGTAVGTSGAGIGIGPANPAPVPEKPVYKTVQYIGVTPERDWTNVEGKVIRGTLLAFEDGPKEKAAGPLTLVRDGKVRLLRVRTNKPSVFPLATLSALDQKFVLALDAENRKQRAAEPKDIKAGK